MRSSVALGLLAPGVRDQLRDLLRGDHPDQPGWLVLLRALHADGHKGERLDHPRSFGRKPDLFPAARAAVAEASVDYRSAIAAPHDVDQLGCIHYRPPFAQQELPRFSATARGHTADALTRPVSGLTRPGPGLGEGGGPLGRMKDEG